VGALLLSAGCGKPAYTYVKNTDVKTYFKVPASWTSVDTSRSDTYFAIRLFGAEDPDSETVQVFKRVSWSVMYDSAQDPSGVRMATPVPSLSPVAYALVTPMPPALQDHLSFDLLRNLIDPVSDSARQYVESSNPGSLPPAFELLDNQILTPTPGMHGIRVVYNEANESSFVHTYDLTALTNNDSSLLYVLLVWCTSTCYREHAVEINTVVTSFTVRSKA
jgi:hypothetical protein